ncbi:hypothetical protein GCM10010238_39400 [Streptomyces griseoviridis]|uniref:Uncharacterized protein n=1 Tax=Streptomyces griseoviridis TaxID=45398 RepID=A0A918LH32_STRGD|nr:hypothetical protein GCM10010238_39400 [Streptomyces niveoruber]
MPRRRPKALRSGRWRPRGHVVVRRVRGVSAKTRAAVRRVEEERRWPGAVARSEWAFRQPGRWLNASPVRQSGLEVEYARGELEEVMRVPPGAISAG